MKDIVCVLYVCMGNMESDIMKDSSMTMGYILCLCLLKSRIDCVEQRKEILATIW